MKDYKKDHDAVARLDPEQYRVTQENATTILTNVASISLIISNKVVYRKYLMYFSSQYGLRNADVFGIFTTSRKNE